MTIELPDIGAVLEKAAERIASVFGPQKPVLNRQQRRDAKYGQKHRGKRERQLQAAMRLSGKGKTRRPVRN